LPAAGHQAHNTKADDDNPNANLIRHAAQLLSALPPQFAVEAAAAKYPPGDYHNCMNAVLVLELERFNKLLARVRGSLRDVVRALKGEAVMTPLLDRLTEDLRSSVTPSHWLTVSYPCLKPLGGYVADLHDRIAYFAGWIERGVPTLCWLGGLFFPQSYITGVLQNFARQSGVTVDKVTWRTQVMPAEPVALPVVGCYLSRLVIEGCRWSNENGFLTESLPKVLLEMFPAVHLFPVAAAKALGGSSKSQSLNSSFFYEDDCGDEMGDNDLGDNGEVYSCPLYRTQARRGVLLTTGHSSNFLMNIELPIPGRTSSSTWRKAGVALFATSSD
jgi:dynein heavy chain